MKRFEDLEVYQKASLSIPLNIAEGFELQSNKQFIKFLYISKGSSGEVRSLIKICERLEYFEKESAQEFITEVEEISKQLSKFINYLKKSEIN